MVVFHHIAVNIILADEYTEYILGILVIINQCECHSAWHLNKDVKTFSVLIG